MDNSIFILVEAEVAPEKHDEFKEIISRMVNHVKETEPKTLDYAYFLNVTGNEFRIIEHYANVEAVLAHNENISGYVVELESMITFKKITFFGDINISKLPDSSRGILAGLYHEIWNPFAAI